MRKILVLFAHPRTDRSEVNVVLAEAACRVEGVTFVDLYAEYPTFEIDVEREQERLLGHDVIVFQHPVYWYSCPALLKEWQDLVLEHGWAYGRDGRALEGKLLLSVITAGGGEEAYRHDGSNRFTVRELLAPIEQTARLCRMEYLPPFVVHGTHRLADADISRYASDYRRALAALRDGRLDLTAVRRLPRLNADLDAVIEG
jgi:glutathione-regulated potassium-efflux system ancillary protein KefG